MLAHVDVPLMRALTAALRYMADDIETLIDDGPSSHQSLPTPEITAEVEENKRSQTDVEFQNTYRKEEATPSTVLEDASDGDEAVGNGPFVLLGATLPVLKLIPLPVMGNTH